MSNDINKPCPECNASLYALADLVGKMRHEQKEYFRTRSPIVMNNAKRYEREVDAALMQIDQARRGTGQQNFLGD